MSACLLLAVGWLAADPSPSATTAAVTEVAIPKDSSDSSASRVTVDSVRESYRELLQATNAKSNPDSLAIAPRMLALRTEIERVGGISHVERVRMRNAVELRLAGLQQRLRRDVERAESRGPRTSEANSLAGGGRATDVDRARELIALIQATIAPESWDVNGGRGSIRYWRPGLALVVRATGETHHQLGGTLEALRK